MEWLDRSIADLYRILMALEQAGGEALIQGLVDRTPLPEDFTNSRVTLRSIQGLLAQTGGSTVLPDEVVALLQRLHETPIGPVPAAMQGITGVLVPVNTEVLEPTVVSQLSVHFAGVADTGLMLEQLRRAAWVHNKITPTNFPDHPVPDRVVTFSWLKFKDPVSTDQVLFAMNAKSFRPATLKELLVALHLYPKKPQQYPFAALGSYFIDGENGYRFPFVDNGGPGGIIRLSLGKRGETTLHWGKTMRFLAVSV